MRGSDDPFPLGEPRIGSRVRGSAAIGDGARRELLGADAAAFFDLSWGRRRAVSGHPEPALGRLPLTLEETQAVVAIVA